MNKYLVIDAEFERNECRKKIGFAILYLYHDNALVKKEKIIQSEGSNSITATIKKYKKQGYKIVSKAKTKYFYCNHLFIEDEWQPTYAQCIIKHCAICGDGCVIKKG